MVFSMVARHWDGLSRSETFHWTKVQYLFCLDALKIYTSLYACALTGATSIGSIDRWCRGKLHYDSRVLLKLGWQYEAK